MILEGDCFELIKEVADNSVDLVITSPPYSNIINYGKDVSVKKPGDYVDWILPLFKEIHRVLKPSGSFILNINDVCVNGYRSTFVYDLISRNNKETKLKLYDSYTWYKPNSVPNGQKKRFRNMTEYIFHFCKDNKQMKFYMERVMEEPKHPENNKMVYTTGNQNKSKEGYVKPDYVRTLPDKVRPDNVFRFPTSSGVRDNLVKHPATFHRDLPEYFIRLLTDEGDLVLDVFNGIGTTGLPCRDLNREYLGFELNPIYADFSRKRIG